jgi:hypothetical protein
VFQGPPGFPAQVVGSNTIHFSKAIFRGGLMIASYVSY